MPLPAQRPWHDSGHGPAARRASWPSTQAPQVPHTRPCSTLPAARASAAEDENKAGALRHQQMARPRESREDAPRQAPQGEMIMPIPQVTDRIKEAPAVVLRALFAGIGQLLLAADKLRTRPQEPADQPASSPPDGAQPQRVATAKTPAARPAEQPAATAAPPPSPPAPPPPPRETRPPPPHTKQPTPTNRENPAPARA